MTWIVRNIERGREIIDAIDSSDDCAAAIKAGAYLEDRLASLLKARDIPPPSIRDLDVGCIANATTRSEAHDEIEITPEMIDAGIAELTGGVAIDLYQGYLSAEEVAASVYRAMFRARNGGSKVRSGIR
jgi:hypothetical protein